MEKFQQQKKLNPERWLKIDRFSIFHSFLCVLYAAYLRHLNILVYNRIPIDLTHYSHKLLVLKFIIH